MQIGDENVHRVRAVMEEIFGEENFCAQITFRKTTGKGSGLFASQSRSREPRSCLNAPGLVVRLYVIYMFDQADHCRQICAARVRATRVKSQRRQRREHDASR
jgi:hypothetical protein